MEVEIFAICDAATNHAGKLNILGAFDTIQTTREPAIVQPCTIAAKIRFMSLEAGPKNVKIQFIDSDGKSIVPTIEATIEAKESAIGTSSTATVLVGIQQLKIPHIGEYSIGLAVDGRQEKTIPLYVQKYVPPQRPKKD